MEMYDARADSSQGIVHPTTVYVTKFPNETTDDELKYFFAACGDIVEARVVRDKKTGVCKVKLRRTDFLVLSNSAFLIHYK